MQFVELFSWFLVVAVRVWWWLRARSGSTTVVVVRRVLL